MWRLSKPIIAAVNGWAMGAGFWYQLAADITIASEEAVFAQPEVRHISASSYLLTALCGWKVANRWALTGDHFDAQEALRIGMVGCAAHQLMEALARARRSTLVPEMRCASTRPSHTGIRPPTLFRAAGRRHARDAGASLPTVRESFSRCIARSSNLPEMRDGPFSRAHGTTLGRAEEQTGVS
jgi:enoyl-CoA hydratase/carnithine racemase